MNNCTGNDEKIDLKYKKYKKYEKYSRRWVSLLICYMAHGKKNAVTLNGVYRVHLNENTRINYVRAVRSCHNFSVRYWLWGIWSSLVGRVFYTTWELMRRIKLSQKHSYFSVLFVFFLGKYASKFLFKNKKMIFLCHVTISFDIAFDIVTFNEIMDVQ